MMIKVDVPIDYKPRTKCFKRKDRDRWILEYDLPSVGPIRTFLTFPDGTTQAKVRELTRKKVADLMKGLLTEKEHEKLLSKSTTGQLTIDQALQEYMDVTFYNKSEKNKENERSILPRRFLFFKEKFGFTYVFQIKDLHVIEYRNYLIKQVTNKEISPSTSQGHLATVRKVFNWLKQNKKIAINPAAEVQQIRITSKDKVRSRTFSQEDILKVMRTPFEGTNGFSIKAFFLWMRETGCRLGEALHLEWGDIRNGTWQIRHKPNCPTRFGLGWSPKWNIDRDVTLSDTALKILEMLPHLETVGYVTGDKTPYSAQFVFPIRDNMGGEGAKVERWRRVDSVTKTWRSLLKAAGLPFIGPERLIRHDLRRTWNIEAKMIRGLDDELCSKQLGNSVRVNNSNYAGKADEEILKLKAKLQKSAGSNLLQFVRSEAELDVENVVVQNAQ